LFDSEYDDADGQYPRTTFSETNESAKKENIPEYKNTSEEIK
jgi:hypothetical protein